MINRDPCMLPLATKSFCNECNEWHLGMEPSVKHVKGVLEWPCVVPEKPIFLKFGVWFPPPGGLAKE